MGAYKLMVAALMVSAVVGCGGSSQFDAKSPHGESWSDFKSALGTGAGKKGCKSEDRGDNFSVTCMEPDYRSVSFIKNSSDELTWTCSMGKSGCREFVDELLSAK